MTCELPGGATCHQIKNDHMDPKLLLKCDDGLEGPLPVVEACSSVLKQYKGAVKPVPGGKTCTRGPENTSTKDLFPVVLYGRSTLLK